MIRYAITSDRESEIRGDITHLSKILLVVRDSISFMLRESSRQTLGSARFDPRNDIFGGGLTPFSIACSQAFFAVSRSNTYKQTLMPLS